MKIEKSVYDNLLKSCHKAPPEMGGVLGGHLHIIDCFKLIEGKNDDNTAFYSPDVKRMNAVIASWQQKGISFYGVFHSHPSCCPGLSQEDRQYIVKIMNTIPEQIPFLYFPVLIPSEKLSVYKAIRRNGNVEIINEDLQVVRR